MTLGSLHQPETEETLEPNGWKWYPKRLLLATSICVLIYLYHSPENVTTRNESTTSTPAPLKYLLIWTSDSISPFSYWKSGQKVFLESKCPFSNCYLTSSRDFFGDDLTKFDAVLFNGRSLKQVKTSDVPRNRSQHQKYIFINLESSDNQPICDSVLDGFFNWTATYKLNSDINFSYIVIRNSSGDEVGPRADMTWVDNMSEYNETYENKTKAAAWFVSHCHTRSKREKYAEQLRNELKHLNLTLDVYGRCGNVKCPRKNEHECIELLKNTYFFYLSFENSFTEDYITEKVQTALVDDVIPIVYGGANYSRYLPPGSYIDARKHEPKDLASVMAHLIRSPEAYNDFFRWKNHYTYHRPEHVCRLCAALNNQTMLDTHSEYKEFRRWWNPDYEHRCKDKTWGS